jgi:hypothetical protein
MVSRTPDERENSDDNERARLNRAELLGTNLAGAKLYGALLGDACVNRETEFYSPSTPNTARATTPRSCCALYDG